jgi:hypothetical protein
MNIDNCLSQMPGSNYSFTSGANTGLNFSSNNNEDEPQQSSIRMAGEVFSNQNDTSNSSNDAGGGTTGSWWRNQYSDMVSGNNENSPSNSSGDTTTPKIKQPSANVSETPTYDADKYRYYESDFGSGTGAEAYAKDMEGYNNMVAMNNGDGLAAGHLGLVSQMMHPDWGRSQRTGGGNPIVEQDYSQAPTGAAYGPGGKKEGMFGASGSSAGQPKGKY